MLQIRIGAMTAFIPDYSALVSEALRRVPSSSLFPRFRPPLISLIALPLCCRCLKPNGILIITEAEVRLPLALSPALLSSLTRRLSLFPVRPPQ